MCLSKQNDLAHLLRRATILTLDKATMTIDMHLKLSIGCLRTLLERNFQMEESCDLGGDIQQGLSFSATQFKE